MFVNNNVCKNLRAELANYSECTYFLFIEHIFIYLIYSILVLNYSFVTGKTELCSIELSTVHRALHVCRETISLYINLFIDKKKG